jgi:hypothetical protein
MGEDSHSQMKRSTKNKLTLLGLCGGLCAVLAFSTVSALYNAREEEAREAERVRQYEAVARVDMERKGELAIEIVGEAIRTFDKILYEFGAVTSTSPQELDTLRKVDYKFMRDVKREDFGTTVEPVLVCDVNGDGHKDMFYTFEEQGKIKYGLADGTFSDSASIDQEYVFNLLTNRVSREH